MHSLSELRRDIVSGEWVVVATGRARRPNEFAKFKPPRLRQAKKTCPFEKILSEPLVVLSKDSGGWWVQVVSNKYPAFSQQVHSGEHKCPAKLQNGPYEWVEGMGFHEIIISRDHQRNIAQMSVLETELIIQSMQERYLAIQKDPCIKYISILQNHGHGAGASISHPHLQIVSIPVIPPDVGRSLIGSRDYFRKHKKCVHCVVIEHELKDKKRIVYENDRFVTMAPFASKSAFEIRIFPKGHKPRFEEIDLEERRAAADALRSSLAKLHKGLNDPDYNSFLHTSPVRGDHGHYHWHIEIVPKTSIWAGFEIGTGIEISTTAPESAAEFLAKKKV